MTADWVSAILNLFTLLVVTGIALFLRSYLPSYLEKKGENLATKEDVEEITDKVERVRSQYITDIEILRSDLGMRAHVHKLQFEREFDILSQVWDKLIDLSVATHGLRPVLDNVEPDIPEQEVKAQRLQIFLKSSDAFFNTVHKNRPFYPQEIFDALAKVMEVTRIEAAEYSVRSPYLASGHGSGFNRDYWERGISNARAIIAAIDEVCEVIRRRIAV